MKDGDLTEFVHACLSEMFSDLEVKGWKPPLSLSIEDRAGLSATAEIDENWEPYDWDIGHKPEMPFTVTVVDEERSKGTQVNFKWLNS